MAMVEPSNRNWADYLPEGLSREFFSDLDAPPVPDTAPPLRLVPKRQNKVVSIPELINPVFYPVWKSRKSHKLLKGGRSSTKSSVISLRLVRDFLKDDNGNVICLRKVGNTLSMSVYEQIKWAIYAMGVQNQFFFGRSPLVIRHKRTGTGFYFFGVDDPLKLKSAKIAKGYIIALWFEEAAEFDGVEEIDTVEDSYIRQKLPEGRNVEVWLSYNPPRNPYAWVNEYAAQKESDPDFLVHASTYLDDVRGFLSEQILRKIRLYEKNDPQYWRWMYLGEIIGLGDLVYNAALIHKITALPSDDRLLLVDIADDTGHQVSATTFLALGLTAKGRVILLDTYYYSPENQPVKLAPSELSAKYKKFRDETSARWRVPIDRETIDSAEGALRNQIFKDWGLRLHPIAKLKKVDMIDNVQDLFAQGRFYMLDTDNNKIFEQEHQRYAWDPDTLQSDDPKVVKENDHTCDALQYYVLDNLRKLRLKV